MKHTCVPTNNIHGKNSLLTKTPVGIMQLFQTLIHAATTIDETARGSFDDLNFLREKQLALADTRRVVMRLFDALKPLSQGTTTYCSFANATIFTLVLSANRVALPSPTRKQAKMSQITHGARLGRQTCQNRTRTLVRSEMHNKRRLQRWVGGRFHISYRHQKAPVSLQQIRARHSKISLFPLVRLVMENTPYADKCHLPSLDIDNPFHAYTHVVS